jgi:hypothetical protein
MVVKDERVEQAVRVTTDLSHHLSSLPWGCPISQTTPGDTQFQEFLNRIGLERSLARDLFGGIFHCFYCSPLPLIPLTSGNVRERWRF